MRLRLPSLRLLPGLLLLSLPAVAGPPTPPPANIAAFGQSSIVDLRNGRVHALGSCAAPVKLRPGTALQIEWNQPRDVRTVQFDFAGADLAPADLTIEWWRRIWPDNGTGGWMKLDDPFNGNWTKAKTTATRPGPAQLRFDFAPLDAREAPGIKLTGFAWRHTYKIRIAAARPVTLKNVALASDAVEKQARLRFQWNVKTRVPGRWAPQFEARNGRILKTTRAGANAAVVEVAYADTTNRLSADRGLVICRSGELRSFSVFVDDVLREGGLFVRDIGAFVSNADANLTYATWSGPPGEVWNEGTIAEQVARLPEQSFAQVRKGIPPKPAIEVFLGAPHLRQEIALGPGGDIRLYADSLRSPGPDAERRPATWTDLSYQFRTGPQPVFSGKDTRRVTRTLEENWLPVVRHEWKAEEVAYAQTCVAAPLLGDIAALRSTNGCEPLVLVTRFEFKNTAAEPRTARLWMQLNHPLPWKLAADGTLVLDAPSDGQPRPGLTPVRGHFTVPGRGRLEIVPLAPDATNAAAREAVRFLTELAPGETQSLELAVPYIELLDARELRALKSISFAPTRAAAVAFWKARVARGMTYEVPEQFLNEFFKASLWHILISTDIDPVTGHYHQGAATHHYKNYLNETAMVARSLEMRGEHEEAWKLLEPFLASQGAKGLPGNFKSKEGVFYAAHPTEPDPYTAQGYNMHHGWGLWAIAEHFYWTGDRDCLRRVAGQLVKGCDWVTRERQATKWKRPDGSRPVEYGLAPAGDLEDVEEYLYFYATDAYYYLGLKRAADALGRVGHPVAKRLARDAAAFLRDIQASVAESVAATPVVRLKDGSYVPFVPPRAYAVTHRSEGWIREGLYPALHLLSSEVYPATHPFADWMIEELEDNIFLSRESGYGVENQRANFFNFGGFTLQPNLPDLPLVYLERDQVPNFLRGFYNTCWASLYPDAMCFAEWVPAYGKGAGPLFKTPDEAKFIQWMRAMLILERGDTLELGLGVPRAWMADGQRVKIERAATFFGPLDLEINSHAARGEIRATVSLQSAAENASSINYHLPNNQPLEGARPGGRGAGEELKRGADASSQTMNHHLPNYQPFQLCLRSPDGRPIRSASVNGRPARVNVQRQLIELPAGAGHWEVVAEF